MRERRKTVNMNETSEQPAFATEKGAVYGNPHRPRKLLKKPLCGLKAAIIGEVLADRFAHRGRVDVSVHGALRDEVVFDGVGYQGEFELHKLEETRNDG